jgi:hypothetical protein
LSFERVPENQSTSERYLALIKDVLALDGFMVSGELNYGGHEFHEGKCYISVHFTDERFGYMKKIVPALQAESYDEVSEA